MVAQQALFDTDVARARRGDPDTSHLAARGVNVTDTQRMVLGALIAGAATDDEICARIERLYPDARVTPQSVRSRRKELCQMWPPKVTFSGEHGTSANGGRSRKWRLA